MRIIYIDGPFAGRVDEQTQVAVVGDDEVIAETGTVDVPIDGSMRLGSRPTVTRYLHYEVEQVVGENALSRFRGEMSEREVAELFPDRFEYEGRRIVSLIPSDEVAGMVDSVLYDPNMDLRVNEDRPRSPKTHTDLG